MNNGLDLDAFGFVEFVDVGLAHLLTTTHPGSQANSTSQRNVGDAFDVERVDDIVDFAISEFAELLSLGILQVEARQTH